jgi:hypothetical protein
VTPFHDLGAIGDTGRTKMTAVVNVTELEDVELGDVSIEPLHQQPIEFSWHNITVGRKGRREESRSVPNGLSGVARAGRLLAIMGPS